MTYMPAAAPGVMEPDLANNFPGDRPRQDGNRAFTARCRCWHGRGCDGRRFRHSGLSGMSAFATRALRVSCGREPATHKWRAVTMMASASSRRVAPGRYCPGSCRSLGGIADIVGRRCGCMAILWHFRRISLGRGAKAALSVLFGTTGLSGVSVFATPGAGCGHRSGRTITPLPARRFIAVLKSG